MKTQLATLLLVGLNAWFLGVQAQNDPAPGASVPKPDKPAAAAPAAESAPAEAEEVLPLVQFEEAPLVDVIKTLARQAGLNLIFDPQVVAVGPDGRSQYPPVSIRLENVTAQNVLEAVLNNNNLRLERDPKTKISRVTVKDPKAADPLNLKLYQLKYTNPSNLVSILKPTFGTPRSQAIPDGRTSQLIVLATEKELIEIDGLIEKLDTATRQVLIEARILETFRNPSSIKGINWAGTLQSQEIKFGNNTFTPEAEISNNPLIPKENQAPALLFDTARGFNPATAFLDAKGVYAVFSFFNQDNESEIIATPRAVTADNVAASLNVSKAIPIFKVTTGGTQSGPTIDITYTNIGTMLEVTPRISANNTINLKVVPEVSNVEGQDKQVVNGQDYTANIFAVRRIQTSVLIPSGNTLVLGGLMSDATTRERSKVPLLGDLPGMKYVFGHSGKSRKKANLLIFLTPTIVSDADFHPTETEFLKRTPPADKPDGEIAPFDKPWDGVEPHDWGKPVY
jgi:type II secretory pathway component GspD/PulD (secretin)